MYDYDGYVHMSAGAPWVQKRVLDLLEMELQILVSSPVWVLGTELRSIARTVHSVTAEHLSTSFLCVYYTYILRKYIILWIYYEHFKVHTKMGFQKNEVKLVEAVICSLSYSY